MTTLTIKHGADGFLDRESRGMLPDYNHRDTNLRFVGYDMGPGMEIEQRTNSIASAMITGGAVALACMAQHYGAIDSSIISSAVDILGNWGVPIASAPVGYVIARAVQR